MDNCFIKRKINKSITKKRRAYRLLEEVAEKVPQL